ncbi:MAG TPA: SRPBCC domain-containing protein [Armatimonadota bacterium]|jgi:uncharacterized protein YndB with AHSA1/START domain
MTTAADRSASVREMILTREFDAPRAIVFRAWIEPEQMARWWGPKDFTNPVCELDPRPGGSIRIDMRAPDGAVYPMTGTFLEVVEPERLVFTSTAFEDDDGEAGLEVVTTVAFAECGGKTRLTVHANVVHASPEMAGALNGMDEGWSQSLDRLADLAASTGGSR